MTEAEDIQQGDEEYAKWKEEYAGNQQELYARNNTFCPFTQKPCWGSRCGVWNKGWKECGILSIGESLFRQDR